MRLKKQTVQLVFFAIQILLYMVLLTGCSSGQISPLVKADDSCALGVPAEAQDVDGIKPGLAAELTAELLRVLELYGTGKSTSAPPMTDTNQVTDLVAQDDGQGGALLTWSYVCVGDYDQNGEVNVADITPLGVNYGATSASAGWSTARLADGDGNGEVNIADITPIGRYFGNEIAKYQFFGSLDQGDYPTTPDGENGIGTQDYGEYVPTLSGSPGDGRGFSVVVPGHIEGSNYWLRPVDRDGRLGCVSNLALCSSASKRWVHTWGRQSFTEFNAVMADGHDFIYCAGVTTPYGDGVTSVMLIKLGYAGNLVWAKEWPAPGHESVCGLVMDINGDLLLAGTTNSYGAGSHDLLVQKWDADGALLWSRTWGGPKADHCRGLDTTGGDIYVSGFSNSFSLGEDNDAVLLRLDNDGGLQWAKRWGGTERDEAWGVDAHRPFGLPYPVIHVTGLSRSYSLPASQQVFHMEFFQDGTAGDNRVWGHDYTYAAGKAIIATGVLSEKVYIVGEVQDGTSKLLLLEANSAGNFAKLWTGAEAYGTSIYNWGDSLYATARAENSGDSHGLLLRISTAGAFEGARSFMTAASYNDYAYCARPMGDEGVVIVGTCGPYDELTWPSTGGSLADADGYWFTQMVTVLEADGASGSPGGSVVDVTSEDYFDSNDGGDFGLIAAIDQP